MHVGDASELLRDPERIRRTLADAKQHVIAVPVGLEAQPFVHLEVFRGGSQDCAPHRRAMREGYVEKRFGVQLAEAFFSSSAIA